MKTRSIKLLTNGLGALISLLLIASASAQTSTPPSTHATHVAQDAAAAAANTTQEQQELAKLRAQVQMLEQRSAATAMAPAATPGMGGRKMGMEREMPMKPATAGTPMPMAPPGKMAMGREMPMPPATAGAAPPMAAAGMEGEDDMPMAPAPAGAAPPMAAAGMEGEDDMPMAPAPAGAAIPMPSGGGMDMMQMMQSMMGGGMMGPAAMGGTNSPTAMATPSALPGYPGQSHLFHIGATGFYLDHPEHITLTAEQQQMLALHKQQALLEQSQQQAQIDAAEQALWQLTGADQPQLAAIEAKAREIEALRSTQRIAFIRQVSGAARVLTDQQRLQLTGMAPATPMPAPPAMNDM